MFGSIFSAGDSKRILLNAAIQFLVMVFPLKTIVFCCKDANLELAEEVILLCSSIRIRCENKESNFLTVR